MMIKIDNEKIAEIKSSIELLEECKEKVLNNEKLDEKSKKLRIEQIDDAINEEYKKGKLQYGLTKKQINDAQYGEVSQEYKDKYEKRLKAKGLTHEQLIQKEQAVVMEVTGEEVPLRKRHRRSKRTDQRDDENGFDATNIERVENEDELMKQTMAIDNKDLERRRHKRTDTMSDVPFNKPTEEAIGTIISEKKIKSREDANVVANIEGVKTKSHKETKRVIDETFKENDTYNFDVSQIPSNVQYDILPLPSKGECYPHKKNRIPVAYLTAADENIIASPNMYRDGKLIDIILERKILDKSIRVQDLCKGDRDAIILWLRATGYGIDFPITARHPETGKQYSLNVRLDTFKYYPFNLKGDENGYFTYTTSNGDVLKFKYLSLEQEDEVRNELISRTTDFEKYTSIKYLNQLHSSFMEMSIDEKDINELEDCIADIKDILNINNIDIDEDNMYTYSITNQMIKYTMSVNGNEDRDYIKEYIENMRSKEAYEYRKFVSDNVPGVNLNIKVNVPKSDGGGTFETFLVINDYVFTNL